MTIMTILASHRAVVSSTLTMVSIQKAAEKCRSTIYSMCECKLNVGRLVMFSDRNRPEQMARRLKEERHGS